MTRKVTEKTKQLLNDKAWARWTALILVASMMFFAYMFVDVMSPLQALVEKAPLNWSASAFGNYAGAEYMLNVFGFLIVAGIILDKMGVRFTGTLSASVMVIGAAIKLYAISDLFIGTALDNWLSSWWVAMPGSAKLAALGFMIFGCGCEMAGITVSKAIAKWFDGKEMALAMGFEMAIARLGVFAVMWIAPIIADDCGNVVSAPIGFCALLLLIGFINYTVFSLMDTKPTKSLRLPARPPTRRILKTNSIFLTSASSYAARCSGSSPSFACFIIQPFSPSRDMLPTISRPRFMLTPPLLPVCSASSPSLLWC